MSSCKKRVSIDVVDSSKFHRTSSTLSREKTSERCHRSAEFDLINGTLPKRRQDSTKRSAPSLDADARHYRALEKLDDDLVLKLIKRKQNMEGPKHPHLNNNNQMTVVLPRYVLQQTRQRL